MIKIVAAVRRRPGMTHAEFLRYIEDVHGGIAKANPLGLVRYVQNHVFDGVFGKAAYGSWFHRDSVTELYFPGFPDLLRTFTDPYTHEVVFPDSAKFGDLATNVALPPMGETVLQVPPSPGAGIKVMQFMKATGDASSLAPRWEEAHEAALVAAPSFAADLRGHVRSLALPQTGEPPKEIADYFASNGMPEFDGVASFWLPDESSLEGFRSYEAALAAQGLFDGDMGFSVFAREVEIFDLR